MVQFEKLLCHLILISILRYLSSWIIYFIVWESTGEHKWIGYNWSFLIPHCNTWKFKIEYLLSINIKPSKHVLIVGYSFSYLVNTARRTSRMFSNIQMCDKYKAWALNVENFIMSHITKIKRWICVWISIGLNNKLCINLSSTTCTF